MLSAFELSNMRTDSLGAMPDTCDIVMATETSDGMGGMSRTWSDRAALVACRMSPTGLTSETERDAGARLTGQQRWTLTLPHDQAIELSDRVRYPATTGDLYEVEDFNNERTWELTRRVQLVRLS